ncbi:hypothetical protein ASF40_20625 [Microbacterium sp. Leaf288]|uniref:molybdenum cofactor biosynthesis protein MoaE n=1 Tax=Microbacterium sp. Leaf288 TaxID=1736323 RepID=UPI0006F66117|nr:molybdenum cofactor biosynthesis protein MoaE [Microbacterium sp. Leaf288]KQP72991.1 hypothetical protein ASF40_20625 [Microbacterium sp. Leaf288]
MAQVPLTPANPATRVRGAFLSDEPISSSLLSADVSAPTAGACVSFDGVVRDHDNGRSVTGLQYSAHPTAETVLQSVALQIAADHPEVSLSVAHRVGALTVGDCALACVVWSAHRGDAFRACIALVDGIKANVPIWKEQTFTDGGTEWVNSID